MPSDSFIRFTSFTVASGPAASAGVIVSILRLPRSPPAPLISSAASVCPLSDGAPSTAPGPERIVTWPNFTGRSGMRPFPGSSAAVAGPATGSSVSDVLTVAAPMVTPSRARNSRRSIEGIMRSPSGSRHGHGDRVNAVPPGRWLCATGAVGRAAVELVASRPLDRPRDGEALPRRRRAARIEHRVAPGRSTIHADVDARHVAGAPRLATDLVRPARDLSAIGRTDDDRVDVEIAYRLGDRLAVHRPPAIVEPRREQALGPVTGEAGTGQPFHRVRFEEARHGRSQREALLDGERHTIHGPREQHAVPPGVLERHIFHVVIAGDTGDRAAVGRLQPHRRRFGLHAGPGQNLDEWDSAPDDVADATGRHVGLHR